MQEDRIQSERPKGRGPFEYLAMYWTTVIRDCKKYGGTFLDALQRLRKTTVSVRPSDRISARLEQRGSYCSDFCEI